ncbi:hypothetical protein P4689_27510 [Priestia megaterium]|uniref:hypothetical protein n=1 Tax=Priestia megaterium TaxID=1404 RepID=UPI002E23D62F|nr:hypothetical protein [Priestia megaterium]
MGSNGFSSERKQKRVDLLKQLLDTNISTQGSSNPLEALLSGLDLGSLEGLMQKNKKSHHDDWDSKKKRHHDDCSDHDWDHKKKHDHDDCGCKKKKHDHDDCGCKKKHDHDDCGCKKKERCKCEPGVKAEICDLIESIFTALSDPSTTPTELRDLLKDLQDLLEDCCIPKKLSKELQDLIDELVGQNIPAELLEDIEEFLKDLLKCLGFRRGQCGSDGGGIACGCPTDTATPLCNLIFAVLDSIPTLDAPGSTLLADLAALRAALLAATCITGNVRSIIAHIDNLVRAINSTNPGRANRIRSAIANLVRDLFDLIDCLNCERPGGGGAPVPGPAPITTIRQRLLDLLADQVVITTPTGIYGGTLVAVQTDYIAVVSPTGTYLIPLDQIQTFTTE